MHEAAFSGKSLSQGLKSIDDYINAFIASGSTTAEEFSEFISSRGKEAQENISGLSPDVVTARDMATSARGLAGFANWNEAGTALQESDRYSGEKGLEIF